VTRTRGRIDTTDSPDDEHLFARNMQRIGINKYKKQDLRQVGYLQKLLEFICWRNVVARDLTGIDEIICLE